MRLQQQANIDELVRPELVVRIVEHRLQSSGPGSLVNLIVDGQQFAGGQFGLIVPAIGLDRQSALVHVLATR